MIERGVRFPDEPIEAVGFRKHVLETREPLMINEDVAEMPSATATRSSQVRRAASMLFVPLRRRRGRPA